MELLGIRDWSNIDETDFARRTVFSATEICKFVKNGKSPYFRPTLLDVTEYEDGCSTELAWLIRRCWAEDPADRPESHYLKNFIKRINK